MIFTSYSYLLFLLVSVGTYFALPIAIRKYFLIAASFFFYATWNWRYLFLLVPLALFNWAYARWVLTPSPGRLKIVTGVIVNLTPLFYFKYSGFFVENLCLVLHRFGMTWHLHVPNHELPLGISFFTFQGLAYLLDVAGGDATFARLSDFLVFKGFWPQLIAGPIIRPHEIRDQIEHLPSFKYQNLAQGAGRVLFGLAKKVLLADNLADVSDTVFLASMRTSFLDGVVGTIAFGMQIYFDFSAYSDIAIGSAKMLGFDFPENFNWPYLASSPQDFWNRWHMTLSRWIRDYLFTPLTLATRKTRWLTPLWLAVAMAICGLWHGANWTYVAWGVWHGLWLALSATLLAPLFPSRGKKETRGWRQTTGTLITLLIAGVGWILFRSPNLHTALQIVCGIFTLRNGLRPAILRENYVLLTAVIFVGTVICHWCKARLPRVSELWSYQVMRRAPLRAAVYTVLIILTIVFDKEAKAFVYFQF